MEDGERDRVFFQRLRHFVALLLRTKEMDQFLRSLKTQFSNAAQSLYESFLDILFEGNLNAVTAVVAGQSSDTSTSQNVPQKKDVFKQLTSMEECRNALVI